MAHGIQCIYCQSVGPFNDEHALPRCLGEFMGFPVLIERVCTSCNHQIGKAEEQFCRSGPEAFFRRLLGIGGRPSHEEANPFERGSAGAKPIDFIALHPALGIPILWELNPGEKSAREVRQIILVDEQGSSHPLRIHTWMQRPEQVREAIDKLGLGKLREIRVFASAEERTWVEGLLQGLGERFEWLLPQQPLTITDPVATMTVTSAYLRAIAKIGFHYFLAVVPEVRGSEPRFAALREFIISGGETERFVVQERTPLIGLPPGYRPERSGHVLVAEWQNGIIQVGAQFFLGSDYEPPVHRIKIAEGVDALKDAGGKGHFFAYFLEGPRGRYHGEVSELIPPGG